MVGRITGGSNLFGVLRYNGQKVNDGQAVVLGGNCVIEGQDPARFDMDDALRSFEPYLAANQRTKNPVFHASLNPDPRDTLTDEQLTAIAQEYMERMGYAEQPYYIFKHRDIDRLHIHIVSVRVDAEGRKIDHNFERRRSVEVLHAIEQKYGLHPAREGEEKRVFDTVRRIEYGRDDLTQQLRSAVRLLAQDYRFGSLSEFRTLLNLYNVDLEQRRGVAAGKAYDGIVYTAADPSGKWLGRPIKASALTPKGGLKFLQSRIERNTPTLRDEAVKNPIRATIARAMHRAHTKDEFIGLLKAESIDAVLRENADGRITGATFIDHRSRSVLNGSRLGKSYSANVFQELFNNPRADRAALLPKLPTPTVAPQAAPKPEAVPEPKAISTPTATGQSDATRPKPEASRPRPVLVPDAVEKMRATLSKTAERIPAPAPGLSPQQSAPQQSILAGVGGVLADVAGRVFDDLPDEQTGMTPEELDAWRDNIRRQRRKPKTHTPHL